MQEKRRILIESAMQVVAEKGLQRSTTAEIARRAGVGEGTLYRYFTNKEELIEQAAFYVSRLVSDSLLKNHDEKAPVYSQYVNLCITFLKIGMEDPLPHRFMEQFRNSPQGIEFKKNILEEVDKKQEVMPFFPLSEILHRAIEQQIVKDYPFQVLASLTVGPLIFILKDGAEGLLHLDEELMRNIAKACWDSIRR